MAENSADNYKSIQIANISSISMFILISAAFVLESLITGMQADYFYSTTIIAFALFVFILVMKNTANKPNLAFNSPFILTLLHTALVVLFNWHTGHYMVFSLALIAISCVYSHFNRTLAFIIVQNIIIAILIFTGVPINGPDVPLFILLLNWGTCLFASIIMLVLTRAATVFLSRALLNKQSFVDLLDTTENFVAMINEKNEVVYASRSLAQLANTEEPLMVQGRPILDLFPGRSLKIYGAKMLRQKEDYAEDWEFTLLGQKRYFKASSYGMRGVSGNALISLYDMTHLAERDEITVMKDSMKIGLFFMDSNYVIQDHYSRYLEEMLADTRLYGKLFTDIIADSVNASELEAIKDYIKMVVDRSYDQDMLEEINPLSELHYFNRKNQTRKVFQFAFATVERGHGEIFILVTVYDITARVDLQQRLAVEEARRQEEMQSLFELIKVEPGVFSDFMQDVEIEFENIDSTLKSDTLTTHDTLVKIYQSVHSIKSNAVTLGLSIFGGKAHHLESNIKRLRAIEGDVPFSDMLNLTMEIDRLSIEKDGFKDIIDKLHVYTGEAVTGGERQNVKVLIESLTKTASKAADDLGKLIKFSAGDVNADAVDKTPRRIIKEILMQLIRNSAVHGIEAPDARAAKGKSETGTIKLSVKMTDDQKFVHIKYSDDGQGLDYKKIAQKAMEQNLIKEEDADNKEALMKIIFSPGFSTADTEGIHGGRGIGLNLVRDRIKEINGTVKIKSEEDKGVVFLISIPAVE